MLLPWERGTSLVFEMQHEIQSIGLLIRKFPESHPFPLFSTYHLQKSGDSFLSGHTLPGITRIEPWSLYGLRS